MKNKCEYCGLEVEKVCTSEKQAENCDNTKYDWNNHIF